ncbi:MAG: permease-like cell division protein FtsX [Burkholderiales bacterium]
MSAWFNAHQQALARATARLRAQPLASLLSTFVIAIAIVLPLGLYIVFNNVVSATSRLNTDPNMNVFMKLAATDAEVKAVENKLRIMPNTASTAYVSRDVALAELKKRANVADLIAGLETNPLPHAFTLRLKSTEPATIAAMRAEIAALPTVETVTVDFEWARKLARFARFAERVVMLLGALLSAAVVFVVGNTIRLQMLTQKDEIIVARLIGATRRFVRRPFLYFGFLQGALAGLFALAMVVAGTAWVVGEIRALAESYGSFAVQGITADLAIAVVLGAGALGWIGAYASVGMYWRQVE